MATQRGGARGTYRIDFQVDHLVEVAHGEIGHESVALVELVKCLTQRFSQQQVAKSRGGFGREVGKLKLDLMPSGPVDVFSVVGVDMEGDVELSTLAARHSVWSLTPYISVSGRVC